MSISTHAVPIRLRHPLTSRQRTAQQLHSRGHQCSIMEQFLQPQLQVRLRCAHNSRSALQTYAASENDFKSFNPFKDKKKEEAAKKALQDAFQGKGDLLAAYDRDGGDGGKGGKKGGGGGGGGGGGSGGGWELPDWRGWGSQMGGGLKKALQTIAAILLFVFVIFSGSLVKPIFGFLSAFIAWGMRLDRGASVRERAVAAATRQLAGTADLGVHERSILAKYGSDDIFAALRQPGSGGAPQASASPGEALDSLRQQLQDEDEEEDEDDDEKP
eukprot:jgi/Botrbrau1/18774/Bobra.0386s0092.1